MHATFFMFSLFYRELKEALVLMVLQEKGAEKEPKVPLHIHTEGALEIFKFPFFSQVREAHG